MSIKFETMGMSSSKFSLSTHQILEEYTLLTYLSKPEISRLYRIFSLIDSDKLQDLDHRFPTEHIEQVLPQLKYNPFKDRIYRVFSSQKDDRLSFEDILEMCSVMSDKCPDKIKAAWTFRIFDYDEDDVVGEHDLRTVIDKLTNDEENLAENEQKTQIIQVLLKEMDSKGSVDQLEFQDTFEKLFQFSCFKF